jgi:predicted nucleic acid-binding protein
VHLLDTNILLELMLARDRKTECKELLKKIQEGKESGAVTEFSLHSIMVIMETLSKLPELRLFLSSLSAYKGLLIFPESRRDKAAATDMAMQGTLDLEDALQYSVARTLEAKSIVTFDTDFDNLEIPKKEPRDILPAQ